MQKNTSLAQSYTEQEIKSAFICNFVKFTQWPAYKFSKDTSSVVIAVAGYEAFGEALPKMVKSAQWGSRKMRLIKVSKPEECKEAHVLYLGVLKDNNIKPWIEACQKNHILSISEVPDFCRQGGVINFSRIKVKYGFQMNPKNAQKSKLQLSPKLLTLAEIVQE